METTSTTSVKLNPETTQVLDNIAKRQTRFFSSMEFEAIVLSLYQVAVQLFCSWLIWESHSRTAISTAMWLGSMSILTIPLLFRAICIQMLAWGFFVLCEGAPDAVTREARLYSPRSSVAIGFSAIILGCSVTVFIISTVLNIVKGFPL